MGRGLGENGEKVQGIRSINGRYKIDRKRCAEWRGIKGRKKWDNCNSIINKIYLNIMKK